MYMTNSSLHTGNRKKLNTGGATSHISARHLGVHKSAKVDLRSVSKALIKNVRILRTSERADNASGDVWSEARAIARELRDIAY